jgi:arsenite methyltransferase
MNQSELKTYLDKTDAILGNDWLDKATSDPTEISSYYNKLRIFYDKMHSKEGAMHFPIKPESGGSHAEGLLFHVNDLDRSIKKIDAKRVIELGCGVGYNIINLARMNPTVQFLGLDLTPKNINEAQSKINAKGLGNISFQLVNFDKFEPHTFEEQDLIFSIEALCHSANLDLVIKKCQQLLSSQGKLIIYDGYGTEKIRNAGENEQKAANYFAKGFFLPQPQYLSETVTSGKQHDFQDVIVKDYTPNVLSNFDRFEDGVKIIFRFPWLTKLLIKLKIMPIEFLRHGLAGLYGPYLLKYGFAGYFRVEFFK